MKRGERGAALLAVLWLTVILTFMAMALSTTTRTEVEATRNLVEGERGYFLARGALEAALYVLTSPQTSTAGPGATATRPGGKLEDTVFRPGQRALQFELETGSATVEILPETGKLDVNSAPREVLARLFASLGLPEQEALELALAVDHWRRPAVSRIPDALDRYYAGLPQPYPAAHRPVERLEELLLLRGMTRELFYGGFRRTAEGGSRRPSLADLLTVYAHGSSVDPNYAHPALLASLPGLSAEAAAAIVAARERRPFQTAQEAAQYVPGIVAGEALSSLSVTESRAYTLVAHARAKDAELVRSVRLTFVKDDLQPLRYRLLEWNDRP